MKQLYLAGSIALYGLMAVPAAASTPATPTPAQLQTIKRVVASAPDTITDKSTKTAVVQAQDTIAELLLRASCSREEFQLSLGGIQALTAQPFNLMNNLSYLPYHPKDRCVSVKNLGNWHMEAQNVLTFNVIYASDVSGETTAALVKLIFDNGKWLVLEHMVRS